MEEYQFYVWVIKYPSIVGYEGQVIEHETLTEEDFNSLMEKIVDGGFKRVWLDEYVKDDTGVKFKRVEMPLN